jgi:hypothetical protein
MDAVAAHPRDRRPADRRLEVDRRRFQNAAEGQMPLGKVR